MPVTERLVPRDSEELKEKIKSNPQDPSILEQVKTHVSIQSRWNSPVITGDSLRNSAMQSMRTAFSAQNTYSCQLQDALSSLLEECSKLERRRLRFKG